MAKAKESTKTEDKDVKKTKKIAEIVSEAAPVEAVEKTEVITETTTETDVAETDNDVVEKPVAKAGRRSAKSLAEVEEIEAKEERKKSDASSDKPKNAQKPPRSRIERAGKKYREAAKQIDKAKTYNLSEALELATKTSTSSFDATIEMHINLLVDPKQADQNVRDIVVLPHGTGKSVRVAVFAEGDDVAKAKDAGADIVGSDELLADLDKGQIDFDVLVSNPALMARLGKYAKILGPKGLMPNPKSGTVTADISRAVKEAKAGRVEFRVDQAGIIHLGIGKVSFGPEKLGDNAQAVIAAVRAAKPASVKGTYISSTYVTSTMGPSIRVEL